MDNCGVRKTTVISKVKMFKKKKTSRRISSWLSSKDESWQQQVKSDEFFDHFARGESEECQIWDFSDTQQFCMALVLDSKGAPPYLERFGTWKLEGVRGSFSTQLVG